MEFSEIQTPLTSPPKQILDPTSKLYVPLSFSGDYTEIEFDPVQLGKTIKIEMDDANEHLEICEFEVYEGETFDLISNRIFERIHSGQRVICLIIGSTR